ncbi:MAG: IS1595 family transposase [Chloroflexi bacterium]|nr:IS1595 family transposase [Chloroflexota bacterium]MYC00739.1 IS1595 family transposase [Chloroflexota bacterium]
MTTETEAQPEALTLIELFRRFPDNETARAWFEEKRWGGVPYCPHCGSEKVSTCTHKSMTHRCGEKECRKRFSVRVGTSMQGTHLDYQTWAVGIFLLAEFPKGVSSVYLGKALGIPQSTAWSLGHRIRAAWHEFEPPKFQGAVEVDETYVGGKYANMHKERRQSKPQKFVVVGAIERETGQVYARPVNSATMEELVPFVHQVTEPGTKVYTDEAPSYNAVRRPIETVAHARREWARGDATTNRIESVWRVLKDRYRTHHWWSRKHLHRYVDEVTWRLNHRSLGTLDRMAAVVRGMVGKRLPYSELIGKPKHAIPSQGALDL